MVNVELIGGLGNNMFQYAIGKIIANTKEYNLNISNIHLLSKYFPNISNVINKKCVLTNQLNVGYGSTTGYIQNCDIDAILEHDGLINLRGFFQKHQFYTKFVDMLRSEFEYNSTNFSKSEPGDLVVHVRLGDYVSLNHFLQPHIYLNIIQSIDYDRCVIVTDEIENPYLKEFLKLDNCIIQHSNNIMQDFHTLKSAKNLILSQSTFSWWAALLGYQQQVFVPLHENGYPWKLTPIGDDIDLIPTHSKYIKIKI